MSSPYPANWKEIAFRIKENAHWTCERCAKRHDPAAGYCLTVHHLDGNKANCQDWNLAALCQRCHLKIQGRVKMDQLFFLDLLPVSGWFKPHLEGYLKSKQSQTTHENKTHKNQKNRTDKLNNSLPIV